MRAVLALPALVGLVAAGFAIVTMMLSGEPSMQAERSKTKAPPQSQEPRRAKITISRTRRAERRVTPYATLLPAPVVTALSEPVAAVQNRAPTAEQVAQLSNQGLAPAPGRQPARRAPLPQAGSAGQMDTAPDPPLAQEPVRQVSAPKNNQPDRAASARPQAGEKSKARYRLPYAKATQPLAGGQSRRTVPGTRRESSRFRRAIPESTGVLNTATKKVYLAGVDALNQDATCELPSGENWPCGRIGTFALRRLIRSRSIVCAIIEHRDENSVLAQCKVARVDINRWLIRNGWARPADGSPAEYADALNAAQAEKKGQWREVSAVGN